MLYYSFVISDILICKIYIVKFIISLELLIEILTFTQILNSHHITLVHYIVSRQYMNSNADSPSQFNTLVMIK